MTIKDIQRHALGGVDAHEGESIMQPPCATSVCRTA